MCLWLCVCGYVCVVLCGFVCVWLYVWVVVCVWFSVCAILCMTANLLTSKLWQFREFSEFSKNKKDNGIEIKQLEGLLRNFWEHRTAFCLSLSLCCPIVSVACNPWIAKLPSLLWEFQWVAQTTLGLYGCRMVSLFLLSLRGCVWLGWVGDFAWVFCVILEKPNSLPFVCGCGWPCSLVLYFGKKDNGIVINNRLQAKKSYFLIPRGQNFRWEFLCVFAPHPWAHWSKVGDYN